MAELICFLVDYFDDFVQKTRYSIASALELRLLCIKPSICKNRQTSNISYVSYVCIILA